uniref:Uncharacterized protein n=1 Tax=Fusarium oxysporum (strain Fo5176) TaxID=660025 RepID=A0A0D2Y7E9_FUSOF
MEPLVQIMKAYDSHPETPIKYICLAAIRVLSHAISEQHPVLRELSSSLTQRYEDPTHPGVKIPLTPIYFWHDKPHLASTAHYLERVFPSRLAMLRGDFIEDKIGQRARAQMKEGLLCLKHLQGRTWAGAERQADRAAMWRERNEAERAAQDDG